MEHENVKMINLEKNNCAEFNINKKVRYKVLDNYKGILIFLVVFTHFLYEYSLNNKETFSYKIVTYIYTFHMPSFIFCSGFLSKSDNSRSFKTLSKLFLKVNLFDI